ncbi:cyclin-dependent kinase inhibitor 1 [Eucyclogobius newberryi]|uniref:cyclin-dependent kinase inhibitor 1 n=1 Tax=Eucyclogobius newberryi TaxID=166745 RepID=UPI003B5B89B9
MCKIMAVHKPILSPLGNGPTRRNLFGPMDREQLQIEYQTALRKDLEEASIRWGFDFIRDKPLDNSDFKWEGIPGTKLPLLYRSCKLEQARKNSKATVFHKGGRAESPQSDKEYIPHSPERCFMDLEKFERTPEQGESTGLKRKQLLLIYFYQAKRRVVEQPRKSGE